MPPFASFKHGFMTARRGGGNNDETKIKNKRGGVIRQKPAVLWFI